MILFEYSRKFLSKLFIYSFVDVLLVSSRNLKRILKTGLLHKESLGFPEESSQILWCSGRFFWDSLSVAEQRLLLRNWKWIINLNVARWKATLQAKWAEEEEEQEKEEEEVEEGRRRRWLRRWRRRGHGCKVPDGLSLSLLLRQCERYTLCSVKWVVSCDFFGRLTMTAD